MARTGKTINSIISAFRNIVSIIGAGFISNYLYRRLSTAINRCHRPGRVKVHAKEKPVGQLNGCSTFLLNFWLCIVKYIINGVLT
jgi:hypothetical protein